MRFISTRLMKMILRIITCEIIYLIHLVIFNLKGKTSALSDDDSDRRDAMVANSNHFLDSIDTSADAIPIIDSIHFP